MSKYVKVSFDEAFKFKNKLKFLALWAGNVPLEDFNYKITAFFKIVKFNKEKEEIVLENTLYRSYLSTEIDLFVLRKDYLKIKNEEELNVLDYI